jgi:16S rRNA (guanine527-N7)-methyltransferase
MAPEDRDLLLTGLLHSGIALEPGAVDGLLRYGVLLRTWNERINLVSRKDIENLIPNHVIDSLVALPLFIKPANTEHKTQSGLMVMDLGPGGGFPGIPLKICLPEMELTMVEATQKKAKFLELAIQELGLVGASVLPKHSRDLLKDQSRLGKYDIVTARAVSELKDLVKDSFPFLAPGGRLLAYKSGKADEEIAAAQQVMEKLGGMLEAGIIMTTPGTGKERRIVVVRKTAP